MNAVSDESLTELEATLARCHQREQRLRGIISSAFVEVEDRLEARGELESLQLKIDEYEEQLSRLQAN